MNTPEKTIAKKMRKLIRLRWVCRGEILLTAFISVWANILHAGQFHPVTWGFAALPPLIVLGGYEMVSRVPLLSRQAWYLKWVRPIATAGITFGGAWLSYWHQKSAVLHYTADEQAAAVMPLLVDGLMIIASVSVATINEHLIDLEATQSVRTVGVQQRAKAADQPQKPVKETDRDRIAKILARSPELTVQEIARLAGTKLPYTYNIVGQLRKVEATEAAA